MLRDKLAVQILNEASQAESDFKFLERYCNDDDPRDDRADFLCINLSANMDLMKLFMAIATVRPEYRDGIRLLINKIQVIDADIVLGNNMDHSFVFMDTLTELTHVARSFIRNDASFKRVVEAMQSAWNLLSFVPPHYTFTVPMERLFPFPSFNHHM
jgi:hypothetical protein